MPGPRPSDERGFTLIELLVAMSIGMIVLLGAFMLLDRSFSASGQVADREDALQQGRQSMELMTRQLRSQVCLGKNNTPLVSANDNSVTFYADLTADPQNTKLRTLALNTGTGVLSQTVVSAASGTYPNLVFAGGATQTTTLQTKVQQIQDGAPPTARPVFKYYRYKPGNPDRRPRADCGTGDRHQSRPRGRDQGQLQVLRPAPAQRPGRLHRARGRRVRAPVRPDRDPGWSRMRLIHRCQEGFTTVVLMGTLMVGGLLVAATFAAVNPDIGFSQKDDDSKQAYAAAEAGLSYYLNRLAQDNIYYTHCANVFAPTQNAVNLEWTTGTTDPRRFRADPRLPVGLHRGAPRRPGPERGRHRAVRGERARLDGRPEDGSVPDPGDGPGTPAQERDRQAQEAQHHRDAAAQGLPRLPLLHRPRDARSLRVRRPRRPGLGRPQLHRTAPDPAVRLHATSTSSRKTT